MWDHLSFDDLNRAKQEIERRRTQTAARHAEETKSLEARHAEEIQALDSKQAELELLDGLIESFTHEFNPQRGDGEASPEVMQVPAKDEVGEFAEQVSELSAGLLGVDAVETSNPGPLQVRFPSPNFGAFRRFG
jgi:hypothetical protein